MNNVPRLLWYKPIPGFPGYKACIDGTIYDCRFDVPYKMRFSYNSAGRPRVFVYSRDRTLKSPCVHTLILITFRGEAPYGQVTRHFPDRDVTNNHLNNLQWGTQKENIADTRIHGTMYRGVKQHKAKLTEKEVKEIRYKYAEENYTQDKLAAIYGVKQCTIGKIINRDTWKHVK